MKDLWLQGLAVVLPQVQQELLPVRAEFATLALYIGLVLGATTWGSLADLIGRRLSFNVSIFRATGSAMSKSLFMDIDINFSSIDCPPFPTDHIIFGSSLWHSGWRRTQFHYFRIACRMHRIRHWGQVCHLNYVYL